MGGGSLGLSTSKGQTINRIQKLNKLRSPNPKNSNDRKPYEFKASPYDDTTNTNTTSSYGNNN
jgi:hypothetical protein